MSEDIRLEAIQLSCCLLPMKHMSTLMYLLRFFSDVSCKSDKNKMDVGNLAIVLTPTFFPVDNNISTGPSGASKKTDGDLLSEKTDIIKTLIRYSGRVSKIN